MCVQEGPVSHRTFMVPNGVEHRSELAVRVRVRAMCGKIAALTEGGRCCFPTQATKIAVVNGRKAEDVSV